MYSFNNSYLYPYILVIQIDNYNNISVCYYSRYNYSCNTNIQANNKNDRTPSIVKSLTIAAVFIRFQKRQNGDIACEAQKPAYIENIALDVLLPSETFSRILYNYHVLKNEDIH